MGQSINKLINIFFQISKDLLGTQSSLHSRSSQKSVANSQKSNSSRKSYHPVSDLDSDSPNPMSEDDIPLSQTINTSEYEVSINKFKLKTSTRTSLVDFQEYVLRVPPVISQLQEKEENLRKHSEKFQASRQKLKVCQRSSRRELQSKQQKLERKK